MEKDLGMELSGFGFNEMLIHINILGTEIFNLKKILLIVIRTLYLDCFMKFL